MARKCLIGYWILSILDNPDTMPTNRKSLPMFPDVSYLRTKSFWIKISAFEYSRKIWKCYHIVKWVFSTTLVTFKINPTTWLNDSNSYARSLTVRLSHSSGLNNDLSSVCQQHVRWLHGTHLANLEE